MKQIYRYRQSFGRMGDLESLFVSDAETIAKIRERRRIPLGEVLGKHSEITATIDADTLRALTDDRAIVEFFIQELGGSVGIDIASRYFELEADRYWS